MTHSHDRTLLASLGFADPDKRDGMHSLACGYLAEEAQSKQLVSYLNPNVSDIFVNPRTEVVISKGEGQYQSVIGFLDLRIDWLADSADSDVSGCVIVEVKANWVDVADVIKQINLYRQFTQVRSDDVKDNLRRIEKLPPLSRFSVHWVVATIFGMKHGNWISLLGKGSVTFSSGMDSQGGLKNRSKSRR